EKQRRGVRIEIQGVLGNVNHRVRKEQDLRGQRPNVHAALSQVHGQGKIVRRVGLLKIRLHDGVAHQVQRVRRFIELEQKRRGVELKKMIRLFTGQHFFQAAHALWARGL